jgi:Protein of unknown function (DUF3187)
MNAMVGGIVGYQRGSRITLLGFLMVLATAAQAGASFGPLQTSNRLPLHLLFLKPRPVRADVPVRGELEATLAAEYSNTYFNQHNERWDVLMDMEMLITEVSLVYGLTSKAALRLDLPMVSMGGGFLDGFLENYHDAIGVGNYGREERPKNEYAYRVSKNGLPWIKGQSESLQIADLTVSAQFQLMKARGKQDMSGSVLVSLKLPSGNPDRALGSGAVDSGIYVPIRWSADPWTLYLMPGAAIIGSPHTRGARVSVRNSYALFGGVAYDYSTRMTWLVQLNYYTSPIEKTGLDYLDQGSLELDIGLHRQLASDWLMEVAFSEDLTRALPDFNLRIGLRWTWQSA